MKRSKCIIALALLLAAPTAAKANSHFMNATAHVISLTFLSGGVEERREQKSFHTIKTCLAWKHQRDFLPPQPASFVSFVYCELTEARAEGTAVDVAKSDLPSVPEPILASDVERPRLHVGHRYSLRRPRTP